MPEEIKIGCARPTGGLVGDPDVLRGEDSPKAIEQEGPKMIQVGRKAPDFTAPCYDNGRFGSVNLSDYLGKWVVLCFYPGDFTFV